jgi:hypothetical protein
MMDMETVGPFKTVNDLMKELNENSPGGCDCGNCKCKDEPTEGES